MSDPSAAEDGIEQGKRLIRVDGEGSGGLLERIANGFNRLTWRTPLHSLRLRGRFPLKLLAAPRDPVMGDRRAGQALLAGELSFGGASVPVAEIDFARLDVPRALADHLHGFGWLRDLSTAATRQDGAPVAEAIMRRWLAQHAEDVSGAAWRYDLWGRRILMWAAHAPLILSSSDLVYRSAVLNTLARGARHLDRGADRAPVGMARVAAWAGVVAAGLLLPGGDRRRQFGEEGLERALAGAFTADGGAVCRSPVGLLDGIALLATLAACYDAVRVEPPPALKATLARAVPALLGVCHGDGGLASWQGGLPIPAVRVRQVVEASGVRARPLRQAREWGFQRLAGGATVVSVDAAPPPIARLCDGGCASTLAFEMSDGPDRIIVSCGGGGLAGLTLPDELASALRTTAAHSTLVLADTNSTAIHADGALGRGVVEVEVDRQESDGTSRLEASHDGYIRRHGLLHRRILRLSSDGRELAGEDMLLPAAKRGRGKAAVFAIRFHLGADVEATPTADGLGALLRVAGGPLWQFRLRGAVLSLEESIWIDGDGHPAGTMQMVATGESPAGGTNVSWLLKRSG